MQTIKFAWKQSHSFLRPLRSGEPIRTVELGKVRSLHPESQQVNLNPNSETCKDLARMRGCSAEIAKADALHFCQFRVYTVYTYYVGGFLAMQRSVEFSKFADCGFWFRGRCRGYCFRRDIDPQVWLLSSNLTQITVCM